MEPRGEEEFLAYYDLRWRILRKPWGQPQGSERDGLEEYSIHLMVCTEHGQPLGVGRLHFNTPATARIRYMAVEGGHRGHGIGSWLLRELENRGKAQGARTVVLDAREFAAGFYRRHGYRNVARGPTLFGVIRHVRMGKHL